MTQKKRILSMLLVITLLFLHMSTCISGIVYALEGDVKAQGVLAIEIEQGQDTIEEETNEIHYANGYSLRIETENNLALGVDNGGNAELRDLLTGENVTFTLIPPQDIELTAEDLNGIMLSFHRGEDTWTETFSNVQGEYVLQTSFTFYEGNGEVIGASLDFNLGASSGILQFTVDNGYTYENNTIHYGNGYSLRIETPGNIPVTVDPGGNVQVREVPSGTNVKFVLTVPEEGELVDILVDGARENFTLDGNEEYSYTRFITFEGENNIVNVSLDFGNGGGQGGQEVEQGVLTFLMGEEEGEGISCNENTITYANGYSLRVETNNINLQEDNGGNMELRNLPAGQDVRLVLITPENAALTEEELDQIAIIFGRDGQTWSERFTATETQGEYECIRNFNFYQGAGEVIMATMCFDGNYGGNDNTTGTFNFIVNGEYQLNGNTIEYANGYGLRIETVGNLQLTTDPGGNILIRDIPTNTEVKFVLLVPNDGEVYDILIDGARENFILDENEEYSYTRVFGFGEQNFINITVDFPNQGGDPGGDEQYGVLAFIIGEEFGEALSFEGNTLTYENDYRLRVETEGLSLGVDNGGNAELRNLPSGQEVRFVLIAPEGVTLTEQDLDCFFLSWPEGDNFGNGFFTETETPGEYECILSFNFYPGHDVLSIRLFYGGMGDVLSGSLEICLDNDEEATYEGNTITYSNGYTLTLEIVGLEEYTELEPNGNRNNLQIRDIPSGESIKYILTIPEGGSTETFYDEWDGVDKLLYPEIIINGFREIFSVINNQYVFERQVIFTEEQNVIQVEMNFNAGQGPVIEDPVEDHEFYVDFGENSWTVREKTVYVTIDGRDLSNGIVEDLRGDEVIKINGFRSRYMQVVLEFVDEEREENEWFRTKLVVDENGETSIASLRENTVIPFDLPINFYVERRTSDPPEFNFPQPNIFGTEVSVTSPEGGTYSGARISINSAMIEIPEGGNLPETYETTLDYFYDEETGDDLVTVTFSSLFVNRYIGNVYVNGEEFVVSELIDYSDRNDFLEHYGYQEVSFSVVVDKADSYEIVCDIGDTPGHEQFIGNFLWSENEDEKYRLDGQGNIMYDEDGEPIISDMYIDHALLDLVAVEYWLEDENGEEVTYTVTENFNDDPYIEYDVCGSLVVPEGSTVTMKITPDYGYQIISFGQNEEESITAEEGLSVFSFPIHKGNFHLAAHAVKTDDIVIPESEVISSGSIVIDKDEIESGTVVLTVSDVNDLTEEQIASFTEAGNGFEVSNFIDVDLEQVLYQGNAENVWSNQLKDLQNEATVTLTVEEGVDADQIVILHEREIKDEQGNVIGVEYEVLPSTYDKETNTITFITTSFSNYAIATHTHIPTTQTHRTITKATLTADGSIVTSSIITCSECGEELEEITDTDPIYYPKTFTLSNTAFTYNGDVQKPTVTVKDRKGNVIDSSNYTVTYPSGCKNVGTYTITIKFKGSYFTGTKTVTYNINPKSLADVTVNNMASRTYTGEFIRPDAVAKDNGVRLVKGTDYTITYANSKNVGTCTMTIKGKGNYTGTVKRTFTIKPKNLSDVTVNYMANRTYTGEFIRPDAVAKDGETRLVKGTDYTITYNNSKEIGTCKMVIKGKGNYTGTVTRTFKIVPKGTSLTELTAASKAFTAKWNKNTTQTTGYEITYATDSGFTKNVKTVTINSNIATSKKISSLKGATKYYVKIRTFKVVNDVNYYSSWSSYKYVTTKS